MEIAMRQICVFAAALVASMAGSWVARADLTPEAARGFLQKAEPALVSVRAQTTTTMAMEGRESDRGEDENESTGCVLNAKGLTVVSLTAIDPSSLYSDLMKASGEGEGFEMRSEITDIRLRFADGREVAGQIAVRDRDLDLAFIMPKTPLETPAQSIDLSASSEALMLDPVLIVWRLGKQNNWTTVAQIQDIAGLLAKPRKMYLVAEASMGSSEQLGALAIAQDGKPLGLQLMRKMPGTGKDRPQVAMVILPAREVVAIAGQIESGAIPLEKPSSDSPAPKPAAPAGAPKTTPK